MKKIFIILGIMLLCLGGCSCSWLYYLIGTPQKSFTEFILGVTCFSVLGGLGFLFLSLFLKNNSKTHQPNYSNRLGYSDNYSYNEQDDEENKKLYREQLYWERWDKEREEAKERSEQDLEDRYFAEKEEQKRAEQEERAMQYREKENERFQKLRDDNEERIKRKFGYYDED